MIGFDDEEKFAKIALSLLDEDLTEDEFSKKVLFIVSNWKNTANWLGFWTQASVKGMLFPTFSTMNTQIKSTLHETTNAQEALHKLYYHIFGRGHELVPGLSKLLVLTKRFQEDFTDSSKGIKTHYGEAERWKSVYSKKLDVQKDLDPERTKKFVVTGDHPTQPRN